MNRFKKILTKEIRNNKWYLVFYTLVLSLLLATFFSLICCMNYMPNEFLKYYTDKTTQIDTVVKGDIGKLKLNNNDTAVYYEGDGIMYNITVKSKNKELYLPDYFSGKCFDFDNSSNFFVDKTNLKGEIWGENNLNGIWLIDSLANFLGVSLNENINVNNSNYIIKGIYGENFVPFKASFIFGKNNINTTNSTCHLFIKVTKDTPLLFAKINKAKIEIVDEYNYIGLYSNLLTIMIIMGICCFIIGACSVLIFINLISYLLLKKQKLIYMFISLGATKKETDNIFFGLTSIVGSLSCIFGGILSYFLTNYFSYLFINIIGITNKIPFLWYLPIIGFLFFIIISIICIKRFRSKSIRQGLIEVENEN